MAAAQLSYPVTNKCAVSVMFITKSNKWLSFCSRSIYFPEGYEGSQKTFLRLAKMGSKRKMALIAQGYYGKTAIA
jgi:hypothetical protein